MRTLLSTFIISSLILTLPISGVQAAEDRSKHIPSYVGNVINPREILPEDASAELNIFYQKLSADESVQKSINALMLKEYVNKKGVYSYTIGETRAKSLGFSMKSLMDYSKANGKDASFKQFLRKEGIVLGDSSYVAVKENSSEKESVTEKPQAKAAKNTAQNSVIGTEVTASTDESGMYHGTLLRYKTNSGTNVKSYYLELEDGDIMRIDTWRDLREFIGDEIEVEIEGTKDNFVVKGIFHEGLAKSGPEHVLLLLIILAAAGAYYARRRNLFAY
ncbi:hypothetical protein HON22_01915 [Candidatus Peregrinibacteria bacterium]|jgi:hypothetical protein|nr:hypothetical protein [Candidatus Peregrinibacteria bacterium]